MPYLGGSSCFAQEFLSVRFIELLFSRNLKSNDSVELCVASFPDGSEGALAQAMQQMEVAEHSGVSTVVRIRLDFSGQVEIAAARWARQLP